MIKLDNLSESLQAIISNLFEQNFGIIVPAGLVPNGSTVTKKTGQKEYQLFDSFTIHSPNREKTIKVDNDGGQIRFLVPKNEPVNNISAISDTTLIRLEASISDLKNFLNVLESLDIEANSS